MYMWHALNDDTPLASRRVVQTILESDMIVLGPGSLFLPLFCNIVILEIVGALFEYKAEIAYVCNIMTQRGETEHFTQIAHVEVLHRHPLVALIDTLSWWILKMPQEYMNSNTVYEYT